MKRKLYSLFLLLLAIPLFNACDNGFADTEIFDSPPIMSFESPGALFLDGTDIIINLTDGANEGVSRSPLQTFSYKLLENDSITVVEEATVSVSGLSAQVKRPFTSDLVVNNFYWLISTATDTKGNFTRDVRRFQVRQNFDLVGLIGSATPGGWGADTPMTRNSANPALWEIETVTLTANEAKFRANGGWAINWGASAFPSGTGTQDGPNIPIAEAGVYKVSINIISGNYSFVKK
ncbi:MAG: SusF/SusE family outer membrane protein [Cyclobacteriaceae bacterium]|nr:SusF/SusE family outer membrane protein [Cyclobacteriaceae bacterium]UYN88432.1 MAG: SusF/SusE family outer membrane protein [Cyclobacteriaceae bacterium]